MSAHLEPAADIPGRSDIFRRGDKGWMAQLVVGDQVGIATTPSGWGRRRTYLEAWTVTRITNARVFIRPPWARNDPASDRPWNRTTDQPYGHQAGAYPLGPHNLAQSAAALDSNRRDAIRDTFRTARHSAAEKLTDYEVDEIGRILDTAGTNKGTDFK